MIRRKNVAVVLSALLLTFAAVSGGTGCSASKNSAKAKKGGGSKGTAAASAKQKPGATASGAKASGVAKGAELDGATCDGTTDGVAWCDSDSTVVLCSDGAWLAIDCSAIGGDVCATDLDTLTVDCVVVDEAE